MVTWLTERSCHAPGWWDWVLPPTTVAASQLHSRQGGQEEGFGLIGDEWGEVPPPQDQQVPVDGAGQGGYHVMNGRITLSTVQWQLRPLVQSLEGGMAT